MPTAKLGLLLSVAVAVALAACGGPGGTSPATPTTRPAAGPAGTPGLVATQEPAATPGLAATQEPAATPIGQTERATVVRVVDGDTLVIDRGRGDERLRYIGIDAPESVKPDTPVGFFGMEASAANAGLVEGRDLILEKDVSETDRFGRLLRYAWVEDPDRPGSLLLVNRALVASGYAQAVTFPPDVRYTDELRAAEREAREQGLGLWGEPTPAP